MPINSFDRLQKDIDALTYNARAVLQALQESALAGGTSKGFRIVRADREITLTRVDIYRLYTFYKEWENNNFAITDETDGSGRSILGFNTIRINHDKKPVRDDSGVIIDGGATSTALSKHGQIMYMNRENESMYSNESYWYTLIAGAANPKLITNSAPIPLNLRTPIYDPNLSTTHYNAHPTYLLPNGYHLLDIVGYAGDGKDHYLDGDRWSISATKMISISGDYIAAGAVDKSNLFKTTTNRVDKNAFVWGYNTFAPATYATAGGLSSAALGKASFAIGNKAFASHDNSAVVGGVTNEAIHLNSGVFVGSSNSAYGEKSVVVGGQSNITGDAPYTFELARVSGSSVCYSSCVSTCQGSSNSTTTVSTPGYEIIRIKQSISKVYLSAGDVVLLYALNTYSAQNNSAEPDDVAGSYYPTIKRTITSISSEPSTGYVVVTFDIGLPLAYHVGGKLVRVAVSSVSMTATEITEYGGGGKKPLGYNSLTLGGWHLRANGIDQVVIGRLNRTDVSDSWESTYDARLIVGSGYKSMSYTGSFTSIRQNIFELYDDAMVLSLDGKLTGDVGFSGIISANGKIVDSTGTQLSGTEIAWNKGNRSGSSLKVMEPTTIDGLCNIGVLVSSNQGTYIRGSDTYINATNTHYITAQNFTSEANEKTTIRSDTTLISGYESVKLVSRNTIALSSGLLTQVSYGKKIKFNGPASGSYGGMFIPCSRGDSFTNDADGALLTPNNIFSSSIAEVILPAQSSTELADEYPPDSYLGVLDPLSPRRAHIMTMAGTGTAEPGTSGSLMQLMWGECTVGNLRYARGIKSRAWTGNLCVRKGLVATDGSAKFTPWEPIPSMDDIDNAVTHRFASMSYNKESVRSLYVHRSEAHMRPKKNYTPPWYSRDWFYVDIEAITQFDVMFEQVGSLTLCTCEYIIDKTSAHSISEMTSNGSFIMVILNVGANRLKCKPMNTASGYAYNIDANNEKPHILTAEATLSPLYPVFIDGINPTYPMVSNDGEPSATPDSDLLRIFIPVNDVDEVAESVVGRFSVTYKNLVYGA